MLKITAATRTILGIGTIPLLFIGLIGLIRSSIFQNDPAALALAVTLDLLVTVPALYVLAIRRTRIPKTTVVPVLIVGVVIGSFFLPVAQQTYLSLFKTWILPVIELSVLGYVVWQVRRAIRAFRTEKDSGRDFFTALQQTCRQLFPAQAAALIANEVAVIYYAFRRGRTSPLPAGGFTYHQRSGTPALFGALIFLIAIETFALHLVLAMWNEPVAWVLTLLSVYTLLQLLGFARSLGPRPILVQSDRVLLRYGMMREAEVPLSAIDNVELSRKQLPDHPLARKLSMLGALESHNVVLHLQQAVPLFGVYGTRQMVQTIALHVDDAAAFQAAIAQRIEHSPASSGAFS